MLCVWKHHESYEVAKESGGEDVNAISQGMGRWLAAVKVSVSKALSFLRY